MTESLGENVTGMMACKWKFKLSMKSCREGEMGRNTKKKSPRDRSKQLYRQGGDARIKNLIQKFIKKGYQNGRKDQ